MEGMQAWLSAYHNDVQASTNASLLLDRITDFELSDLHADALQLSPGVVWTALNIDYACHSFSHLGVFFGKEHFHISKPVD
jgi:glycosylphosphatidylinositol transamidase